jgi:sporulation protein YlmC with PRC-barrel domain
MKLNLNNIIGHSVINNGKNIGEVTDILFDEKKWICRYLEVKIGETLTLIPFELIEKANWINDNINFSIKAKNLRESKKRITKSTISRKEEIELSQLFKTDKYWETQYVDSMPNPTRWAPDKVIFIDQSYMNRVPSKVISAEDRNSELRRLSELNGLEAFGINGEVGTIGDLIVDNKKWEIVSFVIRTYGLTGSLSDVLVAAQMIKEVNFVERGVVINMNKEEIMSSPDFRESLPINKKWVMKQYDFNGKPK